MTFAAVVLAAGQGERFSPSTPKQFAFLKSKPVFIHTIERLAKLPIAQMVVVLPPRDLQTGVHLWQKFAIPVDFNIDFIEGASTRSLSSKAATQFLKSAAPKRVLVHDACRPMLSDEFLARIETSLRGDSAASVPVISSVDTLRKRDKEGRISLVDRREYFRCQTPQVFDFETLFQCYERYEGKDMFDDASIVEQFQIPVTMFEGDEKNIKITQKSDLKIVQELCE